MRRRCRAPAVSSLWALGAMLPCANILPARADVTWSETPAESASRIVHKFDFFERDYFDAVPKDWYRFPEREYPDPAFPRYTEARTDHEVGHKEVPSFYLASQGRCVAYRYAGSATRIKPGDYLVAGWIKPDRMRHSRAALSAYYLNWEGQYIASTQRFSELVGAPAGGDSWHRVQVYMPQAPPEAHFIGITCWVVQQGVWRRELMPHRHIGARDVQGGAWFDDIVVLGLPRAILESDHPGNTVEYPASPRLWATVADEDITGLTARVTVFDQAGVAFFSMEPGVYGYEEEKAAAIDLPPLDPGLYTSELQVFSLGEPLLRRTLTFAVLGRSRRPRGVVARSMGVTITEVAPGHTAGELALVRMLGVGAAKLPLWTGNAVRPGFDSYPDALHETLDGMIEARISVIGVLSGPPAPMVRSVGAHTRSLLDILTEDPRGWQGYLHAMVAPYASIFRSWQVGGDGDAGFIDDGRVVPALQAVRRMMREMISVPNLTTVATAARRPREAALPAQNLSVELPSDVRPAFVEAHLEAYRGLGYDHLWVSTPPPQLAGFEPTSVLADWALRILETRWAGADVTFVPQPWRTRRTLYRAITEPTQAYIAYRTIVDTIADARPTDRLNIGATARALGFSDGKQAVMAMWDPAAPPGGRTYTMQLGAAAEVIDLWGRSTALVRADDGRHEITLSPLPVFVPGIEQWLVAFRAGLELSPRHIDFALETRRHRLTVTNPHERALSGEISFRAGDLWEVEPRRVRFALSPGESRQFALDIRHPSSETAGAKTIRALINMVSGRKYQLDVPLELELGLPDVDVWGYAVMEGDRLAIRHGVTNRTTKALSFRTFATYPGRSRQYRVINELLPGQTLTTEYRFTDVGDASGKRIRLGLREVNGPRIHNLELVVP